MATHCLFVMDCCETSDLRSATDGYKCPVSSTTPEVSIDGRSEHVRLRSLTAASGDQQWTARLTQADRGLVRVRRTSVVAVRSE